jgi:hypothetical protein
MICVTNATEVVGIVEVALVAIVLRNVDLRPHRMVNFGARRAAAADDCDGAKRIAVEDERLGSMPPLRCVIKSSSSGVPSPAFTITGWISGDASTDAVLTVISVAGFPALATQAEWFEVGHGVGVSSCGVVDHG